MSKTLVALFNQLTDAEAAVSELVAAGFDHSHISLLANDVTGEYGQYVSTARTTTTSSTTTTTDTNGGHGFFGGLVDSLFGDSADVQTTEVQGVGKTISTGPLARYNDNIVGGLQQIGLTADESNSFAEGLRRGGVIVAVETADDMTDHALDLLDKHNAADVEGYVEKWKAEGYTAFDATKPPYNAAEISEYRNNVIPVIEEELKVGKREVERGRVRISTVVSEVPVQQDITLREEKVTVERRTVNRDATSADFADVTDKTYEITQTGEEAVVSKTARVVEEVVIGKTESERTETVRDTVRRTDVDVTELQGATTATSSTTYGAYDTYATTFRNDFNTRYGNSGSTYEQYDPAYRFGYTYATDKRYADSDWSTVETDLRRDWERDHADTPWENFKDAVRSAWDGVRGKR